MRVDPNRQCTPPAQTGSRSVPAKPCAPASKVDSVDFRSDPQAIPSALVQELCGVCAAAFEQLLSLKKKNPSGPSLLSLLVDQANESSILPIGASTTSIDNSKTSGIEVKGVVGPAIDRHALKQVLTPQRQPSFVVRRSGQENAPSQIDIVHESKRWGLPLEAGYAIFKLLSLKPGQHLTLNGLESVPPHFQLLWDGVGEKPWKLLDSLQRSREQTQAQGLGNEQTLGCALQNIRGALKNVLPLSEQGWETFTTAVLNLASQNKPHEK